jgi:hypothetical protein
MVGGLGLGFEVQVVEKRVQGLGLLFLGCRVLRF